MTSPNRHRLPLPARAAQYVIVLVAVGSFAGCRPDDTTAPRTPTAAATRMVTQSDYTIVDLSPSIGGSAHLVDISDNGLMVGYGSIGGFVLYLGGSPTRLVPPPNHPNWGFPYAISRNGKYIVGNTGAFGLGYATRWSSSGKATDISYGVANNLPLGVNDLGDAVGVDTFWPRIGPPVSLGGLPGGSQRSTAYDINNSGLAVGCSDGPDRRLHAITWTLANGIVDISRHMPRNSDSCAMGVNESGDVTGWVADDVWGERAWTRFGKTVVFHNASHLSGADINNTGTSVGTSTITGIGGDEIYPYYADAKGHVTWLPIFDPSETGYANGINKCGAIAGSLGPRAILWVPASGEIGC